MPASDTRSLELQLSASTELLIRGLKQAEASFGQFAGRANQMAERVDDVIGKMGSRFGVFSEMAASAATKAQRSFEDSFSQIERMAATAVKGPVAGGGVNIGAADAREAANAAQQRAAALSLIEQAAQRAAAGEGVLTEQTRIYLQAASAARIEAERLAADLSLEAGAAERLEIELRAAGAGHKLFSDQQRGVAASSGQLRAASQQLSYQISDVATSFAGGINPMVIFAQQGSQVVQAMVLMKGEATGFVGFLGGPWGAVILGAISILGVFASKHGEAAGAEDAHGAAAKSLIEAIHDLQAATDSAAQSTQRSTFLTLAEAQAKRQLALDTRAATVEQIKFARSTIQKELAKVGEDGGRGGDLAIQRADAANSRLTQLDATLKRNETDLIAANVAFRTASAPVIQRRVAEGADPSLAANGHFERQSDLLYGRLKRGEVTEAGYEAKMRQLTDARDSQLKLIQDSKKKGPRGPSSATLANRAEAARQAVLSDDISFNSEERQARHRLLDATRKTTDSEIERDGLLREDINSEADAQSRKIKLEQSKGDLSTAEAARLLSINEATRKQRLQNVDLDAAARVVSAQYDARQHGLDAEIAGLRIQMDLADTQAERKRIALQLLAAEQQAARVALQKIRDTSNDPNVVAQAQADLARLPAIEAGQKKQVERQNESAGDAYKRSLPNTAAQVKEAIEGIEVNGLQSLNDGLVDAILGAKSLGAVFHDISKQIIADLIRIAIQRAIIGPLADAIFGKATSGSVSGSGGFLGGIFMKHAEGGLITGPGGPRDDRILAALSNGEFVMNAAVTAANLPFLDAMNRGRLPRFADGGLAGSSIRVAQLPNLSGMGGSAGSGAVHITLAVTKGQAFEAEVIGVTTPHTAAMIGAAAPRIVDAAMNKTIGTMSRVRQ